MPARCPPPPRTVGWRLEALISDDHLDVAPLSNVVTLPTADALRWLPDAEKELGKIPFLVRGKARRNTEKYAAERGVAAISIDTLYEAKATMRDDQNRAEEAAAGETLTALDVS